MKFKSGCDLIYQIEQPSTLVFNIQIADTPYQQVLEEELQLDPEVAIEPYTDPTLGNRLFRVQVAVGNLQISYRAITELAQVKLNPGDAIEVPAYDLPLDVLPYLFPSRYCESDRLTRLATAEFGSIEPGYPRVAAIANWIYKNVVYTSGSSNAHTSACDTVTERVGVCRDFAHLGIAFCRALTIPARFVSGYADQLQPPDFHACFEVYLGDRWYLFDATRLAPTDGFIRIGTGRDATDVSFANLFGSLQMGQISVFANPISDADSDAEILTMI